MTNKNSGYNTANARHMAQAQQMKSLQERGVCAFCYENIHKEQKEPIEYESKYWVVKKNDYPYDHTKLHLMLIPKEHVSTIGHLSQGALKELPEVIVQIEKKWKLTHYALGMRSGDMRHTGATVEHLHGHIVVGDTEKDDHEPVRFKMSSRPS